MTVEVGAKSSCKDGRGGNGFGNSSCKLLANGGGLANRSRLNLLAMVDDDELLACCCALCLELLSAISQLKSAKMSSQEFSSTTSTEKDV